MKRHTFCFTVFIVIFGLMSIGIVDAATITEYFDSDPGWISFNLPVNNNDFGFRNSEFAGGNTGEAGGSFSQTEQVAWYGNDNIGDFTGNKILSSSGLMNIQNVEPGYNNNIQIGHFDRNGPSHINGIGFQILEKESSYPFYFRIFYKIGDYEGSLFTITGIDESRTWSYLYDPDIGDYGSLTVSISGLEGNTEEVLLSESQRNSIGTLNTFGLAVKTAPASGLEKCEFYIDNVNYTVDFIEVDIDIKPGSYPNSINLKSKGKVPVAILTTDDFDAYDVDPDTCVFANADPLRWRMEDVDNDSDYDMLFHFKTKELDLTKKSTEATLEGVTIGGMQITGTDSVNIVPKDKGYCKKGKKRK